MARGLRADTLMKLGADLPDELKANRGRFKYRNAKHEQDGFRFDSKLELRRYLFLKNAQAVGALKDLHVHPSFVFPFRDDVLRGLPVSRSDRAKPSRGRPIVVAADFGYRLKGSLIDEWVFEDTKGFDTPISRLKRALVGQLPVRCREIDRMFPEGIRMKLVTSKNVGQL